MAKRALSGTVILCLLLIPLSMRGETKTEQIEKSFAIDETSAVFLEFKEGDGDIRFSSWDKNMVRIRVKKVAKARDEKRATELLNKVKVVTKQDGNSIHVEVQYPKIRIVLFGFRNYPRVDVSTEIMLPVNTNLKCSTDDGDIIGEDIQGDVKLRTDDGEINISGIKGSVSVASEDGEITCTHIGGGIEARSDDGDIHLSGRLDWLDARVKDGDVRIELQPDAVMKRDWKIRTDDGDVEFFAPQDFSARIRIKTDDGNIESELPIAFSKISSSRDLSGRLNQGDHTISIETEDGHITLLPTK
jgi:DUF4097 and DUF4098 domain-containing protein YvlB